jgi:hypothetical protein
MFVDRVQAAARTAAVTVSFLFLFAVVAFAQVPPGPGAVAQNSVTQDRRQSEPGKFDF